MTSSNVSTPKSPSEVELQGSPFVVKTYQLVTDESNRELVSWSKTRDSFVVWNPVEFASEVLPRYFKHNNFCSFIRQLNTYSFHKVENKQWEFKHESFQENRPELLKHITRRKSKKRDNHEVDEEDRPSAKRTNLSSSSSDASDDAAAKAQLQAQEDRESSEEVVRLREMNNTLMREILKLQQQQDSTQDTIKQILSELIQSRKDQENISQRVTELVHEPSPSNTFSYNMGGNYNNGMMNSMGNNMYGRTNQNQQMAGGQQMQYNNNFGHQSFQQQYSNPMTNMFLPNPNVNQMDPVLNSIVKENIPFMQSIRHSQQTPMNQFEPQQQLQQLQQPMQQQQQQQQQSGRFGNSSELDFLLQDNASSFVTNVDVGQFDFNSGNNGMNSFQEQGLIDLQQQ